ncbi:MAG: CapA family protein [Clostridia bacterium]|nr:CapA family protein [Clostridia bacterium]
MKKKGLSFGSILVIVLTAVVLAGCIMVYSAFHSDADVPMRAQKMAGLLSDAFLGATPVPVNSDVTVTTVTQAPPVYTTEAPVQQTPAAQRNDDEITLTLAGMVSFDSSISNSVYNKQTGVCEYQPIVWDIASATAADNAIAVLPQVLNASEKKYSDAAAQPSAAMALRAAGFDTVVISPDDVLRHDAQAVTDTVNVLYQNGMQSCGVNAQNSAQLQWIGKGSVKVALIGYAEKLSVKASNTLQTAAGAGMMWATQLEELKNLIDQAKTAGAGCVLVYYFWQDETVTKVTDAMRKAALEVTAYGADIIVGVGPKRLLPAVWLSTSDDNGFSKRALVMYSLGSLLTESREAYDIAGAMVHVKLKQQGNGLEIKSLSYTPTYIWKQSVNGKDQYRLLQSNMPLPSEMNENQRGVIQRSLQRTHESLQETLKIFEEE